MRLCMDKKETVKALLELIEPDNLEFYKMSFKSDIPLFIPTIGLMIFDKFDLKNNDVLVKDCCGEQNPNAVQAAYAIMVALWEKLQ